MSRALKNSARFVEVVTLAVALLGGSACSSDNKDDNPGNTAGANSMAGSSGAAGNGAAGSSGAAGSGSIDPSVHGSVVLQLIPPSDSGDGRVSLLGRFFDAATPEPFPLELSEELGDCKLLVPALPFCAEPCAPDVCTAKDTCTPYPKPLGVGTLAVTGLGDPLELTPKSSMQIYQPSSLAYPPCAPGEAIVVTAPGLELEASCITPLELTGPEPIPVMSGQSVKVAWVAEAGEATRVRIGLDVSHHGGKKGQIDCDVADTGAFEIPEPLVTKLISLGLAGFPTINVNRVSVGTSPATPNITLLVSSDITRAVDTGVKSCLDDSACEAPEICQPAGVCAE